MDFLYLAARIRAFFLSLIATVAPGVQAQNPPPTLDTSQYQSCLLNLKGSPAFASITPATWQQATPQLQQPDASILPLLDKQPEFSIPVWDYMAVLVDAERVADGRAAYAQWQKTLDPIARRYGVSPGIVMGVWGVESNFGKKLGGRPLLTSLSTLSCFGRRQAYFRGEFADALRIVQNGDIPLNKLNGSWAGAFGQTQFMPSAFLRLAQDGDGDGRKDIVDSTPDALASTANYLAQSGWRSGEPWGLEVRLPSPSAAYQGISGRKNKRPMSYWRSQKITLANGSTLPDTLASAGLIFPAGTGGPAFLVGANFDAIYSYNASENYALAIAHLADLIANPQMPLAFATPWPTDDPGLSRAENRELQIRLLARGYDIGVPDGLIGSKTREAIKTESAKNGLKTDGRAGQKLLNALRQ